MKTWIALGLVLLIAVWWIAAAPRPEIRCCIAESVVFDPATAEAIKAVDRSSDFAAALEEFGSELPRYDDAVLLEGGTKALVTATDGKIWTVDLATHAAEPLVDVPLMAYGIHEAPSDPNHVYLCASHSYGETYPPSEAAGLYRLALDTREIAPIVLRVPDTAIDHERPVVYADSDPKAPELQRDGSGAARS